MIKRERSSPSANDPPAAPAAAASACKCCADDSADDGDRNAKEKKYQRHGTVSESIQRWTARHGKAAVICIAALVFSVFLIPPLKVALSQLPASATAPMQRARRQHLLRNSDAAASAAASVPPQESQAIRIAIPPCRTAPWKPSENLQGKCPGDLKPFEPATSLETCAATCCADPDCIAWQYRRDVGCIQGKDVRLGQEKDGPRGWCSDHPPHAWQGQFLKPHGDKSRADGGQVRASACGDESWNGNEEIGQCFGLGDVKPGGSESAESCRDACCGNEKCGAWQWNKELGCFYGKGMHSCQGSKNPVAFEPFVGRRKQLDSRRYTDKHGEPWQMTMA